MKVSLKNLDLASKDLSRLKIVSPRADDFLPVWQVDEAIKCPVIGTCLSIEDHKKVLNKAGYSSKGLASYEVHRVLMGQLNSKNRVSTKTDNFLRFKYRNAIDQYRSLDEKHFLEVWREAPKKGNLDEILYVAAVRPDLSPEVLDIICGEVHVLGHVNISLAQKKEQELEIEKLAHAKLRKELELERKKSKLFKNENKRLSAEVKDLKLKFRNAQDQLNSISDDDLNREDVKKELAHIQQRNRQLERSNESLSTDVLKKGRKIMMYEDDMTELKDHNRYLRDELESVVSQFVSAAKCNQNDCDRQELCSKRVLIVGGMTKLRHLYRNLVEKSGGYFDYHDGYIKQGSHVLDQKVCRSDLILCPVNCNSHGACLQVKKLCQKHNKQVKMLRGSSVNAISTALFNNTGNQEGNGLPS